MPDTERVNGPVSDVAAARYVRPAIEVGPLGTRHCAVGSLFRVDSDFHRAVLTVESYDENLRFEGRRRARGTDLA